MKPVTYQHNFGRYDITALLDSETVLETWTNLATYEPLLRYGFGENDCLLRYTIYLSSGSGLHSAIPEWPKRKAEALRLAGIKATDSRAESILNLSHEGVAEMRWCWMRTFCPLEFAQYVAVIERIYQNLAKIERPIQEIDGKDSSRDYILCGQLAEQLPDLIKMALALSATLFMGDEEMKRLATERAKPQAETGSIEEKIMKRNQK